jgi:DNA-binding YbaB/EbfC family protein
MLKGLGGLGDMANIMKQAQQMQTKVQEAQERLDDIVVDGESGAGMVKVRVTAKGDVLALDIDATILNADDKEVIEDLVIAALKDGQARAAETKATEMGKLTEGMNLPAGMKLPF